MSSSDYSPSRDEFLRLAKDHTLVPVWREVLGDLETPVGAYRKLGSEPNSFLLESVEHGERWGRYSFIGVEPFLIMTSKDGVVSYEGDPPAAVKDASDPLVAVERALAAYRAPALAGLPPLHGGAVGYIGYDAVRYIERLPQTTTDDLQMPELWLLFIGKLLVFDHLRQRLSVISNVAIGDDPARQYDEAVEGAEALVARLANATTARPSSPTLEADVGDVPSNIGREQFMANVEKAKEYIAAGDIFQVVVSQRFQMPTKADPFDVYRVLRLINPSPYMFFLQYPGSALVGSSPEPHVRVLGRQAIIRPIAGTRPRGASPEEDKTLAKELLADAKERAEHLMLLDLGRNDVGRVATVGSVKVTDSFFLEYYSQVMHIVSNVEGALGSGFDAVDALMAGFPAGTVSGAPKVRAMEIIDELEDEARGPYAGCVGYFSASGEMDSCIVLRTSVVKDGSMYVRAGAGIVADSVPEREQAECVSKARALFKAADEAVRFAARAKRGQ